MPILIPQSGFDLEVELSPQTLQQFVSQLFESGSLKQTYLLDPYGDPSQQLIIQLDPAQERDYQAHQNWQQPELDNGQTDAFLVNCRHDDDHPDKIIIDVKLLIYLNAGLMKGYRDSVDATFHLKEDISTQLLYLGAQSYRSAYQEWQLLPTEERTPENEPTFHWEQYLSLASLEFTNSTLVLADIVNAVGELQARNTCNRIENEAAKTACLAEVDSRPDNYYYDQLLTSINGEIYKALDEAVRNEYKDLGKFLIDNEDSLQPIQLGRIGLNALPNGALGLYLNTRQKTGFGTFMDDGRGNVRAGQSLRSFQLDPNTPGGMDLDGVPGFIGIANAPGYFDRLLPDLIAKIMAKLQVDHGIMDEASARQSLLGDPLPIVVSKDFPGLDLPTNLKIKRIRVRMKEKKFRLVEDGDKEKLPALEIRMDVNETVGKKLKLAGNNLIIYLVPHLVYDTDARTTALRCFLQTNLRVDFFSSLFTVSNIFGPLISAIAALAGKKKQFSEDLGSVIGQQIPVALHLLKQRWDPLYDTGLGWLFGLDDAIVSGDYGEARFHFLATTKATQKFLPVAGTALRSVLPYNSEGKLTFNQLDTSSTDLLFRTPGTKEPNLLAPDLPPYFEEDDTDKENPVAFIQPVGSQSNPYFSFHQFNYEAVPDDEENTFDRIWRISLKSGSGHLQTRLAYNCVLSPMIYFPVCALSYDGRIQLLGVYSTQELEEFKMTVYGDERNRLIDLKVLELLDLTGQNADDLDESALADLRGAAISSVDQSIELQTFWSNIVTEAKNRVGGYPGEARLQVTPLALADLITYGYAVFPGYTAVRQSSGEVYFRNVPNDIISDNLEELPHCFQLHFPEELIELEESE